MVCDVQFAESVTTASELTAGVSALSCASVYGPGNTVVTARVAPLGKLHVAGEPVHVTGERLDD